MQDATMQHLHLLFQDNIIYILQIQYSLLNSMGMVEKNSDIFFRTEILHLILRTSLSTKFTIA